MPDREAPKKLGDHLELIEAHLVKVEKEQRTRNRLGFALLAVIALGLYGVWDKQSDADAATRERIQASCKQQNRAFREYTLGLVRASDSDPNDPAVQERLSQLPRRQCTEAGNKAYFDNAPKDDDDEKCRGDGKGYCLSPGVTTSTTEAPK